MVAAHAAFGPPRKALILESCSCGAAISPSMSARLASISRSGGKLLSQTLALAHMRAM
jgi:hypothetical protein